MKTAHQGERLTGVKRYTSRGVRDLVVTQPLDEPGINAELAEVAID